MSSLEARERAEYEQRVLRFLRERLLEREPGYRHEGNRVRVEDVRLEGTEEGRILVVLLREETRPECLFGWRAPAVEDADPEAIRLSLRSCGVWGPEEWAGTILETHLQEQIEAVDLGLPPGCDPIGINWIEDYRRSSWHPGQLPKGGR